jgi:hypothetical protein
MRNCECHCDPPKGGEANALRQLPFRISYLIIPLFWFSVLWFLVLWFLVLGSLVLGSFYYKLIRISIVNGVKPGFS